MPLFRSGRGEAPAWAEVEFFGILRLRPGETMTIRRDSPREHVYLVSGECTLRGSTDTTGLKSGDDLAVDSLPGTYDIRCGAVPAIAVRICGRWGTPTGPSGVFHLDAGGEGRNEGDPVEYPRETTFDNHYHDCDEYWIIVEGRCEAVSGGRRFMLGPGDCLVTGKGHHHDIPIVVEPVTGVYFEGTLEGEERSGHLWNYRDGPARPDPQRV